MRNNFNNHIVAIIGLGLQLQMREHVVDGVAILRSDAGEPSENMMGFILTNVSFRELHSIDGMNNNFFLYFARLHNSRPHNTI